jgi:hypothetical protein
MLGKLKKPGGALALFNMARTPIGELELLDMSRF